MEKVSKSEIENFEFNDAQRKAYEKLKKACEACMKSGLWLDARQQSLNAYPLKYHRAITTEFREKRKHDLHMPVLTGAHINDAGADDQFYFNDKYIED